MDGMCDLLVIDKTGIVEKAHSPTLAAVSNNI